MKLWLVTLCLIGAVLADSDPEPKADADADADLGPHAHPHPHVAPHASPAPHLPPHAAPHYSPAPYTPAPPPYGYTPVYGHEPAYSPAPYAPHVPHAPHAPHHPAPYAPHHAAPHDAYHGPPKCAKLLPNKPYAYCLEDPEYPTYEIQQAIEYNYDAVQQLYKDVLANTENSVDRLHDIVEETYLCPSETKYIQPLRAVNVHGKWRIIVNHVKAHYETLSQTARVEECTTPGVHCPLVPECYEKKCWQKSIYHRFLVYDPYDKYLPFAIESFKLPASCACVNGAYIYHH